MSEDINDPATDWCERLERESAARVAIEHDTSGGI